MFKKGGSLLLISALIFSFSCGSAKDSATKVWDEYISMKIENNKQGGELKDFELQNNAAKKLGHENWSKFVNQYVKELGTKDWNNLCREKSRELGQKLAESTRATTDVNKTDVKQEK